MKVMSAIERCRTAALGGHVARCENEKCAHTVIAYNSCRNRHCPKCQGAAAREWLAEREAELLPVPYFHVVYTLPAAIADIAYQNKAVIYDLLFKASAETTLTIAADPKHLGARIGFMSVLHTWGSALTHHPHVHMVVPGGGLSPDGSKWIACRPRYFLTVEVLSALFRRLFLQMLVAAHDAGRLQFFGDHVRLADKAAFKAYLRPLREIDWVVYAKEPFAGPKQVLRYLSRYTHRIAISNRRLVSADQKRRHLQVQGLSDRGARPLQDDDAGDRRVHPALPDPRAAEGLPSHPTLWAARQRQPSRKHRARSRSCSPCRLAPKNPKRPTAAIDEPRVLPRPCPCCGGRMIVIETFAARLRQPKHRPTPTLQRQSGSTPHDAVTCRSTTATTLRYPCWLSAGRAKLASATSDDCGTITSARKSRRAKPRCYRRGSFTSASRSCLKLTANRPRTPPLPTSATPEPAAKSP